jgi:hypothetical protein
MSVWDAPNQQVVRADQSGPGVDPDAPEPGPTGPEAASSEQQALDEMTKDELLAYAQELGVSPANAGMTKDEIRAGIDEHLTEESA